MSLDSVSLTNEVAKRMEDIPSHTVVSMHHIVKETLAVLVEIARALENRQAMAGQLEVT